MPHILLMKEYDKLALMIRNKYPEPISDEEALDAANRLVEFCRILMELNFKNKEKENEK
jgi:hypothetical protein